MKDLLIDEDFDIVIDHRNDLGVAESREQFEQYLALGVTDFFSKEIGSVDHDSAESRIRLHVNRLANRTTPNIDVETIVVERHNELPNTLEVSVVYQGGETFTFEVN